MLAAENRKLTNIVTILVDIYYNSRLTFVCQYCGNVDQCWLLNIVSWPILPQYSSILRLSIILLLLLISADGTYFVNICIVKKHDWKFTRLFSFQKHAMPSGSFLGLFHWKPILKDQLLWKDNKKIKKVFRHHLM